MAQGGIGDLAGDTCYHRIHRMEPRFLVLYRGQGACKMASFERLGDHTIGHTFVKRNCRSVLWCFNGKECEIKMKATQLRNYLPPAERRFDQTGQVPNLGRGLATAGTNIARGLLSFSPGEDVRGAIMSSRNVMNSLRQGNYGQAAINAGYLAAAPIGLAIPGSVRSAKGLLDVNVYPKPPKNFKDPTKGKGQYVDTSTGNFISESSRTRGQIYINPETGKGQLKVSSEEIPTDRLVLVSPRKSKDYPEGQRVVQTSEKGTQVKSNLLRSDKWVWTKAPKGAENFQSIISAVGKTAGGKSGHYYAGNVDFSKGVTLSRYGSQPNLRPTAKGTLVLGKKIGEVKINNSGRVVPFYDKISVE